MMDECIQVNLFCSMLFRKYKSTPKGFLGNDATMLNKELMMETKSKISNHK